MKLLVLLTLFLSIVFFIGLVGATTERSSTTESKITVVYVGESWCPVCRDMEATTLKDKRVIAALSSVNYFHLSTAQARGKFVISSIPTIIIMREVAPRPHVVYVEVNRHIGYLSATALTEMIKAAGG